MNIKHLKRSLLLLFMALLIAITGCSTTENVQSSEKPSSKSAQSNSGESSVSSDTTQDIESNEGDSSMNNQPNDTTDGSFDSTSSGGNNGGNKPASLPNQYGDTSFKMNFSGLAENTIFYVERELFKNSPIMEHDLMRFIVSLQGLVNRDYTEGKPVIYINDDSNDKFWMDYILSTDKMMNGYQTVKITSFDQFLDIFKTQIKYCGIILWDPDVPSTANVSATICGLDGYIPVKNDTSSTGLLTRLKKENIAQKMDLTGKFTGKGTIPDTKIKSSGSSKCDAYLWAVEKYMLRCSNKYIAYMPDGAGCVPTNRIYIDGPHDANSAGGNSIQNHDYLIARRCFFYDLSPVATEAPCDDLKQPLGTDTDTLKLILMKRYEYANGEFGQNIGFPPWWLKYTTHNNMGSLADTVVEWMCSELLTSYNLAKEADAAHPCKITNASLYSKYPRANFYNNSKPKKRLIYDPNKIYFTMYMGDYDSSAWLKLYIPDMWKDEARGTIPLMWAVNPNLVDRVPMIFDFMYASITDNDFFTYGDGGAGYIIPDLLYNDGLRRKLPDGDKKWAAYSKPYGELFNLDFMAFIINGNNLLSKQLMNTYNQIAPSGSFHNQSSQPLLINNGVPYLHIHNGEGITPENPMATRAENMYSWSRTKMRGLNFLAFRAGIQTPTEIKRQANAFIKYAQSQNPGKTYICVDPNTMFDLIRQSGQGTVID